MKKKEKISKKKEKNFKKTEKFTKKRKISTKKIFFYTKKRNTVHKKKEQFPKKKNFNLKSVKKSFCGELLSKKFLHFRKVFNFLKIKKVFFKFFQIFFCRKIKTFKICRSARTSIPMKRTIIIHCPCAAQPK